MSRIFISHSSLNETEAVGIKDWIEANGWGGEVFLDLDPERGLVAGEKWMNALKEAVHRCEAVLPLISKEWLASKWCQSEVGTARLLGKQIIPILIDNTDIGSLPADMTSEQIVDRNSDRNWERQLQEGLKRVNLDPKTFYFKKGRRPYPGLKALTEDDAAIFFGRDAQIVRGLDRIRALKSGGIERLMIILGASGSGKSSFLRAGLWPRLARDDRNFLPIKAIRPELAVLTGDHGLYQALSKTAIGSVNRKSRLIANNLPINTGDIDLYIRNNGLHGYLTGLSDASIVPLSQDKQSVPPMVVLSVDQAEELFSPGGSKETDLFIDLLTNALLKYQRLIVIFSIRSDAYPQIQADPRLATLSQNEANLFNLAPMEKGSYRTIIEGPAKFTTPKPLEIDPLLIEALLEDSRGPDSLPLMAFTLKRLYENYGKDGGLTLDDYKKMGRLEGAIEAAVNDSYNKAFTSKIVKNESEFEKIIKAAFIPHLADVNDADQFIRRVAVFEKLPSHIHDVIGLLVDQHLLIKDRRSYTNVKQDIVEVAHEALLREWPLLSGWLEEEKDNIRAIGAVSRSAYNWKKNGWNDEYLDHKGDRLNEAMKLSMRDDMQNRVGDLEKKYLQAAIDKVESDRREREEQQQRQQKLKDLSERRKKWVMRISVVACMIAIIFGTLATIAYIRADEERTNARNLLVKNYWSNALDSKARNDWLSLLHYAAKAGEIATQESFVKNAIYTIQNHINLNLGTIIELDTSINGAVFNKNETRILTWSDDGTAQLWDSTNGLATGQPIRHTSSVKGAMFNKNETRIITWSNDGKARLWDVISGAPIGQPMIHKKTINGLLLNEDETQILTWSDDGTARLWDATDGSVIGKPMKHHDSVNGSMFNKKGSLILAWSNDGTAMLWDATNCSLIWKTKVYGDYPVGGAVISEDETRILTWGGYTSKLLDATDGSSIGHAMQHNSYINGAIFSKHKSLIMTWSGATRWDKYGTVRLWDATDGSFKGQPIRHDDHVLGAMFNMDEKQILFWSHDGTARLWDSSDSSPIGQPMKHDHEVRGAIFNKAETQILTWSGVNFSSADGSARLWDTTDCSPIGQSMKHDGCVNGAVFNKDESKIMSWSADGTVRLWVIKGGSIIGQPMKHNGFVNGAVFNKDETRILTWSGHVIGTYDNMARLWDAKDATPLGQTMRHKHNVYGAVFNRDQTRILTWCGDAVDHGYAQLWDATNGAPIGYPMTHKRGIKSVMYIKDETQILTISFDGTARLWDSSDGTAIGHPMTHDSAVIGAVFNRDQTRILTWSGTSTKNSEGTARLWDGKDGQSIGQPMKHDGFVYGAVYNHDESRILTWSQDGTARLWDATDGALIGQPMRHDGYVYGAVYNHDESSILTWSQDGTARLWDASDGAPICQPMKHDTLVHRAVYNKNESRILTWSEDGTARLWDVTDCEPVGEPMVHDGDIKSAAYNKEQTHILTWSSDGTARLWNSKDASPIGQPMKHEFAITSAIYNKDETRILTWSDDGSARLWNAKDASSVCPTMKHDGGIRGAFFNKDETRITTWSYDGTTRLWDSTDGSPLGQPMKHAGWVTGSVFNQDESRILTWSPDGTAILWNTEVDEDFPNEHLSLMVKIATGTIMDDYGNVTALSKRKWENYKAEYIRIAEEHMNSCEHKNVNIYFNHQKPNWEKKF